MKILSFLAFSGKSWKSKAIMLKTWSNKSHFAVEDKEANCYIEVWNQTGIGMKWGRSTLADHKEGTPYDVWELTVSNAIYDSCMAYYRHLADTKAPYDWLTVLFGHTLSLDWQTKDGKMCTEGIVDPLATAYKWENVPPHKVSPGKLVWILEAMGAEKTAQMVV